MITKIRDENLRTFQNKDKIYKNIEKLTSMMLVEIENNFKDIVKELRKVVTTHNNKLTISEYENIINFARMVRYIDSLQDPKNYNINGILQYFENFFNENEYFKKPYVNSIFKGDYEKANELKRTLLLRFFKDNQKAITDLFLENKILSVNISKDNLKENQTVEIKDKEIEI